MEIAQARVTLSGTVGTEAECVEVERLIAGVEGVLDITNQTTVERDGRSPEVTRGVAKAYGDDAESGDVLAASKRSSYARPDWARRRY